MIIGRITNRRNRGALTPKNFNYTFIEFTKYLTKQKKLTN